MMVPAVVLHANHKIKYSSETYTNTAVIIFCKKNICYADNIRKII